MAKIKTSYGIDVMSGKVGKAVFSNEQDGVGMREYNPISKQPFTSAQVIIENNFTKANRTWTTLSAADLQKWRDYARTQKVRNPLTGEYRTRRAKDVFVGAFAKLLQLSSASALPTIPTGTYAGDNIGVVITPGAGKLVATATGANGTLGTTEFLVQRLPSTSALPNPEGYHTFAFKKFATGGLTQDLVVGAGIWAVALKFVNTSTGQMTNLVPLGVQTLALSLEDGGAEDAATAPELQKAA